MVRMACSNIYTTTVSGAMQVYCASALLPRSAHSCPSTSIHLRLCWRSWGYEQVLCRLELRLQQLLGRHIAVPPLMDSLW